MGMPKDINMLEHLKSRKIISVDVPSEIKEIFASVSDKDAVHYLNNLSRMEE